jgi:hypothetical protein
MPKQKRGAAKTAPARQRPISDAPPPVTPLPRASYVPPSNADVDGLSAEALLDAESEFRDVESYCWDVVFDGRKEHVNKQQWTVIELRWSHLRPQLDQARIKYGDVGAPADKLAGLDRRIERLDYEWQLVREAASPQLARVGKAKEETAATKSLATHLKNNPDLRRDDAAVWCGDQGYTLSDRGFQSRVWPKAREAAGLDAKANPGRKRKSSR